MYLNLAYKYKWMAIHGGLISYTILKNKISKLICNPENTNSNNNLSFNNHTFTTLNNSNKNLDSSNKNRKMDDKIRQIINEYRQAVLFEDYSDLFVFSDEILKEDEKDKLDANSLFYNNSTRKKDFEEETLIVGDENAIFNRSFIQVNLHSLRNLHNQNLKNQEHELNSDDPEKYFQKVLIFKINDYYYATSSFCGYDLTDLKTGVLLGNKLICPNCLSEYNIENGFSEAGPNIRHLAIFPVGFRKNKIQIRVPRGRVPLFSIGPVADLNNEIDPRHYIIIGDNETVFGTVDYLTRVFSGKISIVSHQTGEKFIDRNKLYKSFFPLKIRHSQFINNNYMKTYKINYYDEKVISIDGIKRLVNLSSGNKIPFDKVLIAVGSKHTGISLNYKNAYKLNSIKDHAAIHNAIIQPEVKSIAIIGNSLQTFEMASSLRRYLDAIDKQDTKIYIISPGEQLFLQKLNGNETILKMIFEYLSRHNIYVFRTTKDLNFEENKQEKKIKKAEIINDKLVFKLPADVFIFDSPNLISNMDFIDKIIIKKNLAQDAFKKLIGNLIIPDERMSLHSGDQYPHIFTAGSCSAVQSELMGCYLRTDNIKANFHLGYLAALNMLEVHYPYDDVVINQARILDKNLAIIGDDSSEDYNNFVTHVDQKNGQFIIYLFREKEIKKIVMYGYDRFHVYLKEAMRYRLLPKFDYVNRHKNEVHLKIIEEMIKNQDLVECFKHKTFLHVGSLDLRKYTVEDQVYGEDITKRNMEAYNIFKEKIDEDYAKNIDEKKNFEQKIRKEKREKDVNSYTNSGSSQS